VGVDPGDLFQHGRLQVPNVKVPPVAASEDTATIGVEEIGVDRGLRDVEGFCRGVLFAVDVVDSEGAV
jgi:hypothetical protein